MSDAAPLWKYIEERERIRFAKVEGKPWPWTEDDILRKYKFTNVKRVNDRTTQAFLQVYRANKAAAPHVALLNCGVRRFTGTAEMSASLGWLRNFNPGRLRQAEAECPKPWTGAYMIRADAPGVPKIEVVIGYMEGLWGKAKPITKAIQDTQTWQAGYEIMHTIRGFGGAGFMCKEVLQDYLLWMLPWVPEDNETWTPIGPGARRGLNRLAGREVGQLGLKDEVYLEEIRALLQEVQPLWLKTFKGAERLTAHDIQFCLCEFDKYERVRLGQGRPRSMYRPPREA